MAKNKHPYFLRNQFFKKGVSAFLSFFFPRCYCSSGVHHLRSTQGEQPCSFCNDSPGCNGNMYLGSMNFETCQLKGSLIPKTQHTGCTLSSLLFIIKVTTITSDRIQRTWLLWVELFLASHKQLSRHNHTFKSGHPLIQYSAKTSTYMSKHNKLVNKVFQSWEKNVHILHIKYPAIYTILQTACCILF